MTPRAVLHGLPPLSSPQRQPRVEVPSTRQREASPPPSTTLNDVSTPATAIRIPATSTPAPLSKEVAQDQTPVRPQRESSKKDQRGAPSQPPRTPGPSNQTAQPVDHSTPPPSHVEEEDTPRPRKTATPRKQRPQPRPGEDLRVPETIKDFVAPTQEDRQPREINNPPRELLKMVLHNTEINPTEGEPRTSPGPDLGDDLEHFADVAFVAMTAQQLSGAEIVKVFLGSWNFFAQADKGSHVADYNQAVAYRLRREQGTQRSTWIRSMVAVLPKLMHFNAWSASTWYHDDKFLVHPDAFTLPVTIATKFTNPYLGAVLYATMWEGKHPARRFLNSNHNMFCERILTGQFICFAYTIMRQALAKIVNGPSAFRDEFESSRSFYLQQFEDWKRLEQKPAPPECAVIDGRPVNSSAEAIKWMIAAQFKEAIARGQREHEIQRRKRSREQHAWGLPTPKRRSTERSFNAPDEDFEIDTGLILREVGNARQRTSRLVAETRNLRVENDQLNSGWTDIPGSQQTAYEGDSEGYYSGQHEEDESYEEELTSGAANEEIDGDELDAQEPEY
ncbi:hypothetical protein BJ508DRAFT_382148 [Ascobolus immersus RN42]|uniref:Uncharacterized protein n=1 Tax=Ascobolus immersus RN42 TaxID=1160509 RepID=A0A3N4H8V0_ASCIM|nr:hypothetical protein BJ508DRAFT_382148 [Ascobolus immersus RN42]